MSAIKFKPWNALIDGKAEAGCHAVVIIPARNEQSSLAATLDELEGQVDIRGEPLDKSSYEILLLLNNCTDKSAAVVSHWKRHHPDVRLHVAQRTLEAHNAFVGMARRMLMDTAWRRLRRKRGTCGILSTDADTLVSKDWIARNLAALTQGADAVGGVIELKSGELASLPPGARKAYVRDRRYQRLAAELEDRLDPQEGDPWPRHLEHFGASLACTPQAYARAGGMPAVTPLEDVAFVEALRRVGARLRHDPNVKVFTSSRLRGRVDVGLSGQLRIWQEISERGQEQQVQSAAWLAHRFRTMRRLRVDAGREQRELSDYLLEVNYERLLMESFTGRAHGEITHVNRRLAAMLASRR